LYHHGAELAVVLDKQFQGIGLRFQHFALFARRAAKGGLFGGNLPRPNQVGPII
jgi:hypothetical protein